MPTGSRRQRLSCWWRAIASLPYQIQPLLGRPIGPEEAPFQGKGSAVAVLGYDALDDMDNDRLIRSTLVATATVVAMIGMPLDSIFLRKVVSQTFASWNRLDAAD